MTKNNISMKCKTMEARTASSSQITIIQNVCDEMVKLKVIILQTERKKPQCYMVKFTTIITYHDEMLLSKYYCIFFLVSNIF